MSCPYPYRCGLSRMDPEEMSSLLAIRLPSFTGGQDFDNTIEITHLFKDLACSHIDSFLCSQSIRIFTHEKSHDGLYRFIKLNGFSQAHGSISCNCGFELRHEIVKWLDKLSLFSISRDAPLLLELAPCVLRLLGFPQCFGDEGLVECSTCDGKSSARGRVPNKHGVGRNGRL
jgi:hypothetical protein